MARRRSVTPAVDQPAMRLFIFGLGYSAGAFARSMRDRGVPVGGTTRTEESAALLRDAGIDVALFDGGAPAGGSDVAVAEGVSKATHLVMSIAPGEADPVMARYRAALLAAPRLAWIGYLSTVGVYGDHDGTVVDETTPPRPTSRRSIERLTAEQAWRELAVEKGVPLATLRIAGIYGPGRNALATLAAGRARRIVKPGQVFNRIHVDDIVQALEAAARLRFDGIVNLADDAPGPPQDVVAYAASLMGVSAPPEIAFDAADLSPMARSFYGENKRVANRVLKERLGVALRHPDYRAGLDAMWRDGTWR